MSYSYKLSHISSVIHYFQRPKKHKVDSVQWLPYFLVQIFCFNYLSSYYEKIIFGWTNCRKKMLILLLFWGYVVHHENKHNDATIAQIQTVKRKGYKISRLPQPQSSSGKAISPEVTTTLANNDNICEIDIVNTWANVLTIYKCTIHI